MRTKQFGLVIIIISLLQLSSAQVPVFEWVNTIEASSSIIPLTVTTDSSENVIMTGFFYGGQDFDPGSGTSMLSANGGADIFVVKYDLAGNLIWAHSFGSINDDKGQKVFTDTSNNVYIYGLFEGVVDFDASANDSTIQAVFGYQNFLLKIDPNGNFDWVRLMPSGGSSLVNYERIAYHPSVGIVIAGNTSSQSIDYDPGTGVYLQSATGLQGSCYVLALDVDANLLWFERFEQTGTGTMGASAVAVNNSGNIFLTGRMTDSVDLDPGTGTNYVTENSTLWQSFVVKLDLTGNFIWGAATNGTYRCDPFDMAIDSDENVRVIGMFEGTTDFDPSAISFPLTSPYNELEYFVWGLDNSGQFDWAFSFSDTLDAQAEAGIDIDTANNVYIACFHNQSIDADPGVGTFMLTDASNVLIASYAQNGSFNWARSIGGSTFDKANAIEVTTNGAIYTTGLYNETVDFNPGSGTDIHTSTLGNDGFLLKYSLCQQSTPVPDSNSLSMITANCSVDTILPPTASENCAGTIIGTPDLTYPITTMGSTTVTWTYDAGNGFVTTQTQNVVIIDTDAPVPNQTNLSDITQECSVPSLTPPTATDNCGGTVSVTNDATLPITANTTFTWTYDDGNGNTSTQTQNVIITPIDNGITQVDALTLSADASGYSYQWVNCDNGNAPISGATNQNFAATINGNYAVEVSNGNCSVISNCITIDEVGITDLDGSQGIRIYPNPSNGVFNLVSKNPIDVESITLTNNLGQDIPFNFTEKEGALEIEIFQKWGVYFLSVGDTGVYQLIRL